MIVNSLNSVFYTSLLLPIASVRRLYGYIPNCASHFMIVRSQDQSHQLLHKILLYMHTREYRFANFDRRLLIFTELAGTTAYQKERQPATTP
jgi:hypothetical protein